MSKCIYIFIVMTISGCMSYGAWEKGMDGLTGKYFAPESSLSWPERAYFTKEGEGGNDVFKRISEGSDVRYYIYYYYPFCTYSLLVSPEGKIQSWRREVPRENCYVY